MSDLAQHFQEARERLGISMDDAERATKIRRRYIEAIEAGDYGRLPDGPPARGFIRNYARYLGMNPDQSLYDFEAEVGVPVTQLSDIVPPPPEHQQAVSIYTRLVKLPPGRQRQEEQGSEGAAEQGTEGDTTSRGLRSAGAEGRIMVLQPEKQPLSNSFSLRAPEVTQASDVRPFQTGRSPFSLRNSLRPRGPNGSISPETSNKGRKYGAMSMRSTRIAGGQTMMLLGMGAAGLLLVVVLIGFVIVPSAQRTPSVATGATPTQVIKVSILGTAQTSSELPSPNFTPTAGPAGSQGNGVTTTQTAIATATPAGTSVISDVAAIPATPTSQPGETAIPPTVQPLAGGGVQLVLDARERAWVRVRVDGNIVYEGIPQIGPNASWRGQNTVGIETGNAGAFDVILNNTRIGPVGARNATVTISWDALGKPISQ